MLNPLSEIACCPIGSVPFSCLLWSAKIPSNYCQTIKMDYFGINDTSTLIYQFQILLRLQVT